MMDFQTCTITQIPFNSVDWASDEIAKIECKVIGLLSTRKIKPMIAHIDIA